MQSGTAVQAVSVRSAAAGRQPRRVKLTIVSPTYNESANVGRLIEAISSAMGDIDYEILIADDDSPDQTWKIAQQFAERNPRVRVLRRMENPGLGASVIDAFAVADSDYVACIDSDLQHDPRILPQMLAEIEKGADLVTGCRYRKGGGTTNWDFFRRIGSVGATKLAQICIGVGLKDPMSGYFMMRKDDFLRIRGELNGEGFKILLEIAAQLRPCRVTEVPYTFAPRLAGKSKLSSHVLYTYLKQVYRMSLARRLRRL